MTNLISYKFYPQFLSSIKSVSILHLNINEILLIVIALFIIFSIIGLLLSHKKKVSRAKILKENAKSLEKKGKYLQAGHFYYSMGKLKKALKLYLKAKAYSVAGDLYLEMKQKKNALKMYQKDNNYLKIAAILESEKEYLESASNYEKGEDFVSAARLYEKLERQDDAIRCYLKIEDYGKIAYLYLKYGDFEKAAQYYEKLSLKAEKSLLSKKAIKSSSPKRILLQKSADLYKQAGNTEKAAELYAKIGNIKLAGELLFASGKKENAIKLLIENNETGKAIQLLEEAGDYEKAKQLKKDYFGIIDEVPQEKEVSSFEILNKISQSSLTDINLTEVKQDISLLNTLDELSHELSTNPMPIEKLNSSSESVTKVLPELDMITTYSLQNGNRYNILNQLGKGGMGTVYLAKDNLLDRLVAYKVISLKLDESPDSLKYLLNEAKFTAALNHPNIVTLFDIGKAGNDYFLAMEYVEGKTLKEIILENPNGLDIEKGITIFKQVSQALNFAHRKNILHLDIKSSNIMCENSEKVSVKLMDFGLARLFQENFVNDTITRFTPSYVSPEQIKNESVDCRADIYSLGITMYETFTGKLPFREGGCIYHHLFSPPPDPKTLNPNIPEKLRDIILKCIMKKPSERYQSTDYILADLNELSI